ncbi:hypothetical protein Vadar_015269 [Vaccinium darrowii]|uniref:Uncharacterized protein n=1 Tax=Vaccinium darrowii TaxID=229202 RepID=A0ACB7Y7K4_9ERIC|nr:hypothetical protein Vadar_015269 [Vaccinium darrowii]
MEPPNDSAKVSFRRVETKLRKNAATCEEIMVYVRNVNLEGLLHVPFVALDRGLITALVERWRPKTHSFHLRPGEMTVTLQDVEVILGLPVEGEAVTGSTDLKDIDQLCTRLLGKAPSKNNNELQGQKVTMKWLAQFDGQIKEGDGEEVVKQKAKGFLLRMLGGWYDMFTAPDLAQSVLGHYWHALDIMRPDEMRCFGFLNKHHVQPLTAQQYGEVGRIGLLHLAKLSKHVCKRPPVHCGRVLVAKPILENPVIDEVQQELDQFGVNVPHDQEAQ